MLDVGVEDQGEDGEDGEVGNHRACWRVPVVQPRTWSNVCLEGGKTPRLWQVLWESGGSDLADPRDICSEETGCGGDCGADNTGRNTHFD